MPDYVTLRNEGADDFNLPVLQVWVDPAYPDAWRADRDFLAYLQELGLEEGMAAIIRNGETDAIFLAPPAINKDGTWFESISNVSRPSTTATDLLNAGFTMDVTLEDAPCRH